MTALAQRLFPSESASRAVVSLVAAGFATVGFVISVALAIFTW